MFDWENIDWTRKGYSLCETLVENAHLIWQVVSAVIPSHLGAKKIEQIDWQNGFH